MYHVSCIMYALVSVSNFDGGTYKHYIIIVLFIILRAILKNNAASIKLRSAIITNNTISNR